MDAVNWKVYSFAIPLKKGPVRKGLLLEVYHNRAATWDLDHVKAPGLDDRKRVPIVNIDPFAIVQPRELLHAADSKFMPDCGIQDGGSRWGEIAPYPGRSRETLEEASVQLVRFLKGEHSLDLFPSVQCGLEAALCRLPLPREASLYALLSGTPEEVMEQAARAAREGYTTVKLKVSSFSIPEAQAVIRELLPVFRVRVDCNSAFTFGQAVELFSPFDQQDFDYIEDPTHETGKLSAFTHPFALDETVVQYRHFPPAAHPQLKALILKPTLLGGRKGCAPFVAYAEEHNLKVVFSPAFESGVGLLHILAIAQAFGRSSDLIGLDTHRHLEYDLLDTGICFNTPRFCCTSVPGINPIYLTEVAHGTDPLPAL